VKRRVFDYLMSAGGLVVVIVLVVAGALLLWGWSFTNSNVHDQLAKQQIYFPPAAAFAHAAPGTEITPSMIPSVSQYAGQQLLTGEQARVYADDFIAVHLSELPYNGVYATLSTKARAATPGTPQAVKLAALTQTSFQGTTLRGLLLEAYAFSTFGEIALVASIISFVLAGIMLVLTLLGLLHIRRVPEDQEFPKTHVADKVLEPV